MPESDFLLRMLDIEKSFPGVKALKGVQLDLKSGEVLGVVGENGAGKSTLIKVLAGVHQPNNGHIFIKNREVHFDSPLQAQQTGIAVIYQEFNLIPNLTVRENIILGHEKTKMGFFSKEEEKNVVRALFDRMRIELDPEAICKNLSVAQQQLVEIAKALSLGAEILVMDEPSAALTSQEVETLFTIIEDLKSKGIGIIYISHRLDEVFRIADRVTVLRDGDQIGTNAIGDLDKDELIEMMVGRSVEDEYPKIKASIGEPRLVVQNLTRKGYVEDVSFDVRRGEVLGITGLVGAGRTELVRLIFGADPLDFGTISLDGNELKINSPRDAIRKGICLLTEDRKTQGLVLGLSTRENFALPNLTHWSKWGFVKDQEEQSRFNRYIENLKIKVSHPDQRASHLSGGNQQKVLLARWLESNSEVVIFDEPTRGIDVGAKFEIYLLMNELAAAGKAIIMISSELPEILGMSDRILVMHEGTCVGEITDVTHASQQEILSLAVGHKKIA